MRNSKRSVPSCPWSIVGLDAEGSGPDIRAKLADGHLWLGGEGVVYCRPHPITLCASHSGEVVGTIRARFFLGNMTRHVVEVTDGQRLTGEVFGRSNWSVGDKVGIAFGHIPVVGGRDQAPC
jgi:hypothetical protein